MAEQAALSRQSALAAALRQPGRTGSDGSQRLRMGEVRGWNLVQVSAFASTASELEWAVSAALGVPSLPDKIGKTGDAGARRIFRTGPEQFWVTGPRRTIWHRGCRRWYRRPWERLPRSPTAARASSSRASRCAKSWPAVSRSISIPSVFAVGQFALSGIHHTPVLVHRAGEQRFEIYAMRTFALSVWEWLSDAALVFGYEVQGSA